MKIIKKKVCIKIIFDNFEFEKIFDFFDIVDIENELIFGIFDIIFRKPENINQIRVFILIS